MKYSINFIIGITASILTASSLLPQLVKILSDKKAEDISIGMLVILLAGLSLWVTYGSLIGDHVIMFANAASLVINIAIVICTLKYRKK